MAEKATTPTKSATKAPKSAKPVVDATPTTAAAAPLMVNGVAVNSGDVSGGGSNKKQLVSILPLKSIRIVKGFNPRTSGWSPAEIEDLADNIKKDGLLTAVLVRPGADGQFDLICGEKRHRALTLLGWEGVAAVIRQDLVNDDAAAKAVATAENSDDLRKPLNAIEIGRVCKELEGANWTVSAIAKGIGHHEQKVRRCLSLMDAPADVQKRVADGTMAMVTGLEVAKLDDKTRAKIADQLKGEVSAADVRRLAKQVSKGDPDNAVDGKQANKKKGTSRDAALVAWKPNRAKQAAIVEMAHILINADEEQKKSADYFEMRGALSFALWDRGDLDSYLLPSADSEDAKEIKINKQFAAVCEAEAAKWKPAPGEEPAGEAAAADGDDAETQVHGEPEAKTEKKKGKAK